MITYSELWSIQEPLLAMAGIIESWFYFSGKAKLWKRTTVEWWYNLQMIRWPEIHEINEKFNGLFCAIYGKKVLSFRRFIASLISSILFLLGIYFFLEAIKVAVLKSPDSFYYRGLDFFSRFFFQEGEIINKFSIKNTFILTYESLGLNVFPDFISLCETSVILKLASRRESNLMKLVIVDFVFTTLIWLVAHLLAYWFYLLTKVGPAVPFGTFYNFTTLDASWISYVLTTYSTSFFWWLFILVVVFTSIMRRFSTFLTKILETRIVMEIPIMIIVGIPCLLSWIVLFVLRTFFIL